MENVKNEGVFCAERNEGKQKAAFRSFRNKQ